MSTQRPLIFEIPLSDFDVGLLPPNARKIGSEEFKSAVLLHFVKEYAGTGLDVIVAIDDVKIGVTVVPENGQSLFSYAMSLLSERKLKEGLDILQWMNEQHPGDAEVLYNIGICHSEMHHFPEAISLLEACVKVNPSHVNAWVGLGVAYQKLGQTPAAENALHRAITLDPGNGYAHRNLGAVLMSQSRADEALPHFREATHQLAGDPGALFGLAHCLATIGSVESLIEADYVYSQVIERFSGHPIAEMARGAKTEIAHKTLRASGPEVRMDVVMYMLDAMERFDGMTPQKVGEAALEIAFLGRTGLKINDPTVKYSVKAWPEEQFSGLNLLAIMHVGIKSTQPEMDSGTDFDREYDVALAMANDKSPSKS